MKKLSMVLWLVVFLFSSTAMAAERVIHLFLIGPGLVGGELIHQIHENFSSETSLEVRVIGLANSRFMRFDPNGLSLNDWKQQLILKGEAMSLELFMQRMIDLELPHSVFVDCTSSQEVADSYPAVLQAGISIVTPNKKGNSGSYLSYCTLQNLAYQNRVKFLYDSTVGAGLPFIQTLKSIHRSGDSLVKLEAILSGTLSYLFNTFNGTIPFSEVVREAQQKGFTEPDPRDDLNGLDMARKMLILAREAGLPLEMDDVVVQRFIPDDGFEAPTVAAFYQKLAECDVSLSCRAAEAAQRGEVLRFIGMLENGKAIISLRSVGKDHPFYQLSDTDNIGSIYSRVYANHPIVIKGPGAGAKVTAANVLSNIILAGS